MATEDPIPAPVGTKQHNYSQMIMGAIQSLDDEDGSDYIEANYRLTSRGPTRGFSLTTLTR
ncbi:hypothetical protein SAY87_005529 [Trapa incisa]|uniref:Uncharacterized protein n=1 Tax=Trapa incisa TaxID=236973 RepID=A0AAN7Q6M1_9MYRT|nr:hypothetical protein SAY87_005529 [Trapa incisa]